MTIWIDARVSPEIATWISNNFPVEAIAIRDLNLRDAKDKEIFEAAGEATAIIMSKDVDFVSLLDRFGAPPQVIWVTCGNTSNSSLKEILSNTLSKALELLDSGENFVEIKAI